MKENQLRVGGGSDFHIPYDAELLVLGGPTGFVNSDEMTMVRCMTIIHY